jgi:peptide/nickel transport system ATP-binding protein
MQTGRTTPILEVADLAVVHGHGRRAITAVSAVSFEIQPGETLGLVGESGCGKSSTVRAILQLPPPTRGRVRLNGTELTTLYGSKLRAQRRDMQVVLQDPAGSLNPRHCVSDIVAAPLRVWDAPTSRELEAAVGRVLDRVGLSVAEVGHRFPAELSGGQQQRVAIARALVLSPRLVLCDEAVSALDVSVRAQILNLLRELRTDLRLSMLFVSHDLAVVRNICDRVAVLRDGVICEVGDTEAVFAEPSHPYTRRLLTSARATALPVP